MNTETTTAKQDHLQKIQALLKISENREFSNDEIRETLQEGLFLLKEMPGTSENSVIINLLKKVVDNLYRLTVVGSSGFVGDYFQNLPLYKSSEVCFDELNNYYLETFGEKKYKNYQAFKNALGMN